MDLFTSIFRIVVVEDASKYKIDEVDPDDTYSYYTDEQLLKLNDRIVAGIAEVDVLKRIYKLSPGKLNSFQDATISDALARKYSLSDKELQYVLSKLHACTNVSSANVYSKSRNFIATYGVTDKDILNIVKRLTLSDFDCLTQSYANDNFGNDLLVFLPKGAFTLENGSVLPDIVIYLKIDFTATAKNGATTAIMSIHEADPEKLKQREQDRRSGKLHTQGHLKNK